jgi:hypothetical protein
MNSWVLILMFSWTNPAMTSVVVPSEAVCRSVGEEFVKNNHEIFPARYRCIELR